ncbi:hypothetical protein [Clostridium perfringens]|uniref:hypothetical protein n=1 Tax=Clostridium perfringens TaxID=1502 RepID=UPI001CCA5BCF|nr:hypothetical protein [Clostridium perfringens]UBK86166.1 hypothetical protein KLF48_00975 [Clostridium perfringens]
MSFDENLIEKYLRKWQERLRLKDWDIKLQLINQEWNKTGDIKFDMTDKKAIVMINNYNPKENNLEPVIIHELLHLKLWGMDQMIEQLMYLVFGKDENDPKFDFAYTQFMNTLESTVEDLSKSFLTLDGEDKKISFERVKKQVDDELKKYK